ncbi:pro-Pol polyprotein [Trichonephila clavipes]|nr:pro-Pol polyprotein [Trichonephila clavipes]
MQAVTPLGAVLLQGESPTDEQPVEYASRLLSSAEKITRQQSEKPCLYCSECIRYKATNQKPAGLLQTPVPAQRFESIAIDLFGPLPETTEGIKWIFIVEDYTTKWVELFPLKQATAKECAMTLLNEVFLRYGVPRRLISDNGTQFVSAVMQQLCFVLDINQSLIPVYHPQANPVERKK